MDSRDEEPIDSRLRDAYSDTLPDASAVQAAVRKHIASERARLWKTAASAIVILAALAGYSMFRRGTGVYAELARDHRREVVEQQPRRWRVAPAEIAALTERYGVTGAMVAGLAPDGYRLEHAKTCAMAGKPVLHLVYTNGSKQLSIYLRQRSGAQVQPVAMNIDSEQVATFSSRGFEAAIVMAGSGAECLEWARRAAGIL